jgi:hypothetical protein
MTNDSSEFMTKVVTSFKNIFETEDAEDAKSKGATAHGAPAMISTGTYNFKFSDKKAEDHPYLAPVKTGCAFKLKTGHDNTIAEIAMLETLCAELKRAPDEAIVFHLSRGNDFASWVKASVGDWYLGSRIEKVNFQNPSVARAEIVRLLEDRTTKLRNH